MPQTVPNCKADSATAQVSGSSDSNFVPLPNNNSPAPRTVKETIAWLLRLGRPPLPENPIAAAKKGKQPKQPCFLDKKNYFSVVAWEPWQKIQPIPEIYEAWFENPNNGIGTLGGWNGKHWLGWIDFDKKDFPSQEECDHEVAEWMEKYPSASSAPMFRTPGGGYRFLVAFDGEPQNFKASSGFSLKDDGSHHVGELLTKNGAHTLLPPTVGVLGEAYYWVQWSEYPPVVGSPEEIGLYPVVKKTSAKPSSSPKINPVTSTSSTNGSADRTLSDLLENEIYPRLDLPQAFNWTGHNFQQHGDKLKGCCPWHESQSGTAFYCERKGNAPLWRCPACELGGSVIEYRHWLKGGNGSPQGREFVALVKELADEVGVAMPAARVPSNNGKAQPTSHRQSPTPTPTGIDYEAIKADYIKLLEANCAASELSKFRAECDRQYAPTRLGRFLDDVEKEYRKSEDDDSCKDDISKALEYANLDLDVRQFLPDNLAKALILFGVNQSLPQASLLMALITTVSATHPVGTQVLIGNPHNEFYQIPAVNHAMVGASGLGKSTIIRNFVKKPLNKLRKQESNRFKAETEQYEKDKAAWEQSGCSGSQPEPPRPLNRMYLTGATMEGLKDYIAKAPSNSVLACYDELVGLFGSFDQYKGGKGSDRQDFLSFYDGDGFTDIRVTKTLSVEETNVAWLGGIQPAILQKHFQAGASDGLLPRITISSLPDKIQLLPEEFAPSVDITGLLTNLYKSVLSVDPKIYHITQDAYKYFRVVDSKWQHEAARLPEGAMKEFLKKCKGLLGRISLNLHLIHDLSKDWIPSPTIPKERVEQAVGIIEHLLKILQGIHLKIEGESIQGAIVSMVNLSNKRQALGDDGWLTSRDIGRNQNSGKARLKSHEIRELMTKAKNMGYGETKGAGAKLAFKSVGKIVGDFVGDLSVKNENPSNVYGVSNTANSNNKLSVIVGELSVDNKNAQSTTNNGYHPLEDKFVGVVGDFSEFSGKTVGDSNGSTSYIDMGTQPTNFDSIYSLEPPTKPTITLDETETAANNSVQPTDNSPTTHRQSPTTLPTELLGDIEGKDCRVIPNLPTKSPTESPTNTEVDKPVAPEPEPTPAPAPVVDAESLIGKTVRIVAGGKLDGLQGLVEEYETDGTYRIPLLYDGKINDYFYNSNRFEVVDETA